MVLLMDDLYEFLSVSPISDPSTLVQAALSEIDPVSVFRAPDGRVLIGWGIAREYHCPSDGGDWRAWLATVPWQDEGTHPGVRALMQVGFDPARAVGAEWGGLSQAVVRIPALLYEQKDREASIMLVGRAEERRRLRALWERIRQAPRPLPHEPMRIHEVEEPDAYETLVQASLDALGAEELRKVVPAFRIRFRLSRPPEPGAMLRAALRHHPTCYHVLHRQGDTTFVSVTPETLFTCVRGELRTMALAGTGSAASEEDPAHLLHDPKTMREHGLVVDMLASSLREICGEEPRVGTSGLLHVGAVIHVKTDLVASIPKGVTALSLLARLHPTPAVCGDPREKALDFLRRAEPFSRGLYAGVSGWCAPSGDANACVTIRSGLLHDRDAWFFAGAGVVSGSDPAREAEEVALKLRSALTLIHHS